ncbi:hypothetical protein HDE_03865 [Halotydeus destructor]|nr:hypothetical protein HDE_03865 [Halotydeus destructor]
MGRNLSFPLGSLVGICLALVMTQLFDDDCRSRKNFEQFSGSPVPAKSWRRQVEEADFNPVIEIGKRKESLSEELYQLRKSQVKRPRFYSTELEIKYGVYAGILTTEHSYSSLGTSLNMSLAENVDR